MTILDSQWASPSKSSWKYKDADLLFKETTGNQANKRLKDSVIKRYRLNMKRESFQTLMIGHTDKNKSGDINM